MSEPRQHAYTGPALPQLPEPSHAERVRTLFSLASVAALSTLSRKHPGFPFGSLMPFALDPQGRPLFLISNMAMHTQNLKADPRCSLFLGPLGGGNQDPGSDPLGAARATLLGTAEPIPESDLPAARELYLARQPQSRYWIDFADFSFFRLQILDVYYVGGFGTMGWVDSPDYARAAPDPLAPAAAGILAHMNADHADAMILLARTHSALEATEASMTAIDRLGFTLSLLTKEGRKGTRINFPREAITPGDTRRLLVEMVQQARA